MQGIPVKYQTAEQQKSMIPGALFTIMKRPVRKISYPKDIHRL